MLLTAYIALSRARSLAKPSSALGQRQLIRVAEPELIHQEFCETAGANVMARDPRFEANAIEYPLEAIDLFGCKFKA
ncbi:hypothetical protein [Ensifer canadensis]